MVSAPLPVVSRVPVACSIVTVDVSKKMWFYVCIETKSKIFEELRSTAEVVLHADIPNFGTVLIVSSVSLGLGGWRLGLRFLVSTLHGDGDLEKSNGILMLFVGMYSGCRFVRIPSGSGNI